MRTVVLAVLLVVALGACSNGGPAQLLETARFEELQRNLPHARKLYREVVEAYPDTPQAAEARARLAAIGEGDGGAAPATH